MRKKVRYAVLTLTILTVVLAIQVKDIHPVNPYIELAYQTTTLTNFILILLAVTYVGKEEKSK